MSDWSDQSDQSDKSDKSDKPDIPSQLKKLQITDSAPYRWHSTRRNRP